MQSDWANLPTDVLSLIYDRLSVASDCVQFMAVCRSWRCMKKDRKYKLARLTTPMVFVSERKENTWNAYDFVNNQVLGFQLNLPKTRFCGSSNGWIITVENFVVTLRNPQYDVQGRTKRPSIIRLPPLKPQINYKIRGYAKAHSDYFVIKATMSADPISNSKDCIVMVLYEPLSQLAFIRLGKDTRWTYIDKHGDEIYPWIKDVVLIEDKIYAVDSQSRLWAFESTSKSTVDVQLVATGIADRPQKMYLVGSKKKGLLMIYRFSEYRRFTRESRKFRIFELSSNDEWIEKNDLGDIALFVGDNDSVSVVASMHSRCLSSCIYFLNDNDGIHCQHTFDDFGMYNVKSQSVTKPARLRNPVKRTRKEKYTCEECRMRLCGSSKGWIITVENFVVTLRNPQHDVQGRTKRPSIIRLPPLKPQINYKIRGYAKAHSDYFVVKATMSADPISNSKDCIVMVLYEPLSQLAFIRLGKDTRWTYIDKHGDEIYTWIKDVVLIEDKIYAVDSRSRLWAFESTSKSTVDVQLVATGIADRPQKIYLVGSKKKGLLMIYRFSEYRRFTRESRKFRIFELSSNDEWIEKNDLGDIALFVGDNDSVFVVASMHLRYQSNCIYFLNDNEGIHCRHTFDDFGVYNVKSQSVTKPARLRTQ